MLNNQLFKPQKPYLVAQNGVTMHDDDQQDTLSIKGLSVAYDHKPVLFSIDAHFAPHKLTAIVGPNGAGKSTLLKAVFGTVPILSGEVCCFGKPIKQVRRHIAYVPQRSSVDWDFPTQVLDVVQMGLYPELGLLKRLTKKHRAFALECLDCVGMADFARSQIGQLSGGQQQRVFLARALAQNAQLYLLDEPFAGVDAATERAIIEVLQNLKRAQKTVICVHHDLATLKSYFDEVLLLNIQRIAHGDVETQLTPAHLQAAYGGQLSTPQLDQLMLQQA